MKDRRARRFRFKEERRQIVEETLKPGASVSLVARAHDVNANLCSSWCMQYREGQLDVGLTILPLVLTEYYNAAKTSDLARQIGCFQENEMNRKTRLQWRSEVATKAKCRNDNCRYFPPA